MSLGLRYCKNHESEPLMLHQTKGGAFWRCEHADGCLYTEGALGIRGGRRRIVEINGHAVPEGRRTSGHKQVRTMGGSALEKSLVDFETTPPAATDCAAVQPSTPLGTQQEDRVSAN